MKRAETTRSSIVVTVLGAALLFACAGAPDEPTGSDPAAAQGVEGGVDSRAVPEQGSPHGDAEETPPPGQEDQFIAELTMAPAPAEMERSDDLGATSAAEYFLFAYTYAYGTGDTGPVEQMSAPECRFCSSVVAGAQQAHSGTSYMRSGDPVISAIQVGESEDTEVDFVVWLEAQLPQMRTFDAEHNLEQIHPASDIEAGFSMVRRHDAWVILGATFEPAGSS